MSAAFVPALAAKMTASSGVSPASQPSSRRFPLYSPPPAASPAVSPASEPSSRSFPLYSPPPAASPAVSPASEPSSRSFTLYSIPVSFFSARCRFLIHREPSLGDAVTVSAPKGGGMKSDDHMAVSPLGKVPSLEENVTDGDGFTLVESQAISSYLLDVFGLLDAYTYEDPDLRAKVAMVSAFTDNQLAPLNPCLYRAMEAELRETKVDELQNQLNVLEQIVDGDPWLVGDRLTLADVNLFGLFTLYGWAGPKFFGFRPDDASVRPKLTKWFQAISQEDAAKKTLGEVHGALESWKNGGRWEKFGVVESAMAKYWRARRVRCPPEPAN